VDRGFRQNPLGQTVPHPGQAESPSDVEGQVPDAVAKGQQGLDGGQDAVTAGGQGIERIGEGLEIGQGDARERLACRAAEAGDVGAVGALGCARSGRGAICQFAETSLAKDLSDFSKYSK
jgi:hypothetical protein